jgi:hypothetical protein
VNRKVILSICVVCAVGAAALFGFWITTNNPGAKESDYRAKQADAERQARAGVDASQGAMANRETMVAQISEHQAASDEAKRYAALANLEMNQRVARSQRLLFLAAFLGLFSIGAGAVLCLPRGDD